MSVNTQKNSYNNKSVNIEIEILRFFMITSIAILHFSEDMSTQLGNVEHGIIPGGYLGVEFFFLISGFFLAKRFEREDRNNSEKAKIYERCFLFFIDRLKRLYPQYIIATLMMLGIISYLNNFTINQVFDHIWQTKFSYFMLHFLGPNFDFDMRSVWFIPIVLIIGYMCYIFLCINKEVFIGIIPIIDLAIFGYLYREYNQIGVQGVNFGVIKCSWLVGFLDMSLGIIAFYICIMLKERSKDKLIMHVIKFVILAGIIYIMIFHGFDEGDFFALLLMFFWIILSELFPCKFGNKLSKCFIYLGKISYNIYLYHLIVSMLLCRILFNKNYFHAIAIFLFMTYLISVIMYIGEMIFRCNCKKVIKEFRNK